MGKLSTHVLDTSLGKPAASLEIKLYKKVGESFEFIKKVKTNCDGRCDEALLEAENFKKGGFELVFEVEEYFKSIGVESIFLKDVVIRFYVEDESQNYHIPLLISPYSYSTYRGSWDEISTEKKRLWSIKWLFWLLKKVIRQYDYNKKIIKIKYK